MCLSSQGLSQVPMPGEGCHPAGASSSHPDAWSISSVGNSTSNTNVQPIMITPWQSSALSLLQSASTATHSDDMHQCHVQHMAWVACCSEFQQLPARTVSRVKKHHLRPAPHPATHLPLGFGHRHLAMQLCSAVVVADVQLRTG